MGNEDFVNKKIDEIREIMAVPRVRLDRIWFSSPEHKSNYVQLIEKFHAASNPEYASACYVCAHPEIFHRVNWSKNGSNPFNWYWGEWIGKDDDDENGYYEESESVSFLSSSYRSLVRAAVELFTSSNHFFDLTAFIGNAGDEVYRLFIQMLEIRRDRKIVDIG